MRLEPEEQALGRREAPTRARTPAQALRIAAQVAMDQSAEHFALAMQLQNRAQQYMLEAALQAGGSVQ